MKFFAAAAFAAALAAAGAAQATVVDVQALGNSSSGGTGAVTGLNFTTGDLFTVSVAGDDLWSAGDLPRWSNADGLVAATFATGSDESGQSAGTQIGANFGSWTQDGYSAPYGALVGQIGGVFQVLGTSFSGPAWNTGALSLFYWDSNNGDNSDSVRVTISAAGIPEPVTWTLMIGGLGMMGAALRHRRAGAAAAA